MILTLTNYLQVAIKENYLSVDFCFSQSGRETCVGGYKFLAALCHAHEDADMHTETGRERESLLLVTVVARAKCFKVFLHTHWILQVQQILCLYGKCGVRTVTNNGTSMSE